MTLKVRILKCSRRLFIILVSLTTTWFSEKKHGFMSNLIKKSWTDSTSKPLPTKPTLSKVGIFKVWTIQILFPTFLLKFHHCFIWFLLLGLAWKKLDTYLCSLTKVYTKTNTQDKICIMELCAGKRSVIVQ